MSTRKATSKSSIVFDVQGEHDAPQEHNVRVIAGESISAHTKTPAQGSDVKLAAIYARVSTDKQEKEETIKSQLDLLHKAVAQTPWQLLPDNVFVDDGQSGASLERPALERLRDRAYEGGFEVLYVSTPDRLARLYAHQYVLLDELKRYGVEVIFLNQHFGNSPPEQMALQMQGVFAEYERAMINERTRRGRLYAARSGRYMSSNAPYGYTYVRKSEQCAQHLEINEKEAEVVRQMYRWLIEEGVSSAEIAKRLSLQNIPTRTGGKKQWWQSTVIDILRNPAYKGEAYYNRTMKTEARMPHMQYGFKDRQPGNKRGEKLRPVEEWITIKVPALFAEEYWQAGQDQLKENARLSKRNKKREYLLRGLLICEGCGRRMCGNGGSYVCSGRYVPDRQERCSGRSVNGEKIENEVWDFISKLLGDEELLEGYYQEQGADPAINEREEEEKRHLFTLVGALHGREKRLLDAYEAGAVELAELSKRRIELRAEEARLRGRIKQLERGRAEREEGLRVIEGVKMFCESMRQTLLSPTFSLKQQLLRLVVDKIVVKKDKITIYHIIPTTKVILQPGRPCVDILVA